jgi:hypothetical protein
MDFVVTTNKVKPLTIAVADIVYMVSHKIFIHTLDILLYGYHLFQNFLSLTIKSILH